MLITHFAQGKNNFQPFVLESVARDGPRDSMVKVRIAEYT